jgi:hypothetical protein
MALLQGNQGQTGKQPGQNLTVGFGETSDLLVTELQARYYQNNYRGLTFFTSVAAAAPTAYVGAAGGTPLVAVYNPVGSGVNLAVKVVSAAVVAAATAAGQTQFRMYGGPTVLPTGVFVNPFSASTLQASGSKARAVNNAAMTSSSALNYIKTIGTYYWATAAGAFLEAPIETDVAGSVLVMPGNIVALGAASVPTSMTNDASLFWDEVAI